MYGLCSSQATSHETRSVQTRQWNHLESQLGPSECKLSRRLEDLLFRLKRAYRSPFDAKEGLRLELGRIWASWCSEEAEWGQGFSTLLPLISRRDMLWEHVEFCFLLFFVRGLLCVIWVCLSLLRVFCGQCSFSAKVWLRFFHDGASPKLLLLGLHFNVLNHNLGLVGAIQIPMHIWWVLVPISFDDAAWRPSSRS